jgi:hypothetical protein
VSSVSTCRGISNKVTKKERSDVGLNRWPQDTGRPKRSIAVEMNS